MAMSSIFDHGAYVLIVQQYVFNPYVSVIICMIWEIGVNYNVKFVIQGIANEEDFGGCRGGGFGEDRVLHECQQAQLFLPVW